MNKIRGFEYVKRIINKDEFNIPFKGSKKAAGYDFQSAEDTIIKPKEIKLVKTGIKAYMQDDEVLILCNRSSNPIKKGLILINGVGVIDADYYNNPDNDGEIMFAFYNITDNIIDINVGDKIGQGIFTKFNQIDNESNETIPERVGGFGSTDNTNNGNIE